MLQRAEDLLSQDNSLQLQLKGIRYPLLTSTGTYTLVQTQPLTDAKIKVKKKPLNIMKLLITCHVISLKSIVPN